MAFAFLTSAGRVGGLSTAWTAPPPMIAPPQAQAANFAKAIFTDMTSTLFRAPAAAGKLTLINRKPRRAMETEMPKKRGRASALTTMYRR
ncbi:hypothetical protein ACFQRC_00340 [Enterovirga sp. GCM10030262]|uniref:hypothetical protein n=1 Tax=Enterovirga sp. GCM10030262 TaxID=3273391 RepID=UPI00361E0893